MVYITGHTHLVTVNLPLELLPAHQASLNYSEGSPVSFISLLIAAVDFSLGLLLPLKAPPLMLHCTTTGCMWGSFISMCMCMCVFVCVQTGNEHQDKLKWVNHLKIQLYLWKYLQFFLCHSVSTSGPFHDHLTVHLTARNVLMHILSFPLVSIWWALFVSECPCCGAHISSLIEDIWEKSTVLTVKYILLCHCWIH